VSHPAGAVERLAAHALGLPDADPDGALGAHLASGCESCASELRELRETGALLALGAGPMEPPAGLREQILDRISGEGFVFVLAGSGAWEEDAGLERKQLYSVPGQGGTWLLSLRGGTWLEDAYRPGHLGYVVLRGELDGEGFRLGPGDFVPAAGKVPGRRMAVAVDTVLLAVAGAEQATPLDSPRAVRSGKAAWNPMEPGTSALPLAGSAEEGIEISLLRLDPGGSIARHRHEWVEELCVISGDCRFQGMELGPEDYHRANPGTRHDVTTSVSGCMLACMTRGKR
jgi:quercetin dioxygenase-like cupin family protein